jgi:hypothetical protein
MFLISKNLTEILKRTAFFAESHSVKGLLAIDHLSKIEGIDLKTTENFILWNQVLLTPKVNGIISDAIQWDASTLSDEKLRALLTGAVFPMSYSAAVEWERRHGFKNLVESFKDLALERVGYLGHSFTIWCSFYEIEPFLKSQEDKALASERFAEFCASQLSDPDWTPAYKINHDLINLTVNEDQAFDSILKNPGFYGHGAITLNYLLKYKAAISTEQWQHGLERIYQESHIEINNPVQNAESEEDFAGQFTDQMMKQEIVSYLKTSSEEVHSLTLADSVLELSTQLPEHYRPLLLRVLKVFGCRKIPLKAIQ